MRSFAFTLVPLIGLWSPSIAGVKGDDTKFSYPTSDLTFNSYDTIEVSYESSISSPKMVSFCRGSDGSVQQKREDNAPSLDGTVSIQLNFTIDSPDTTCWFNLRPEEDGTGLGGNSPNFKLDSSVADKNTYGVDSPKSTTSSSSTMTYPPTPTEPVNPQNDDPEPSPTGDATSSSSPSASTPSATASSSAAASTSAGLSQGAQAGIGVGVGLVGVISGGAAAFIFFLAAAESARGDAPRDGGAAQPARDAVGVAGGGGHGRAGKKIRLPVYNV
ncbi:hypothetical protein GGR52DRAFT_95311 [Hypoxylon sp. FL1284]|nr:hypothetical protein GGR52DRAFT_95311 [Hypoxylon sp. FL1284]